MSSQFRYSAIALCFLSFFANVSASNAQSADSRTCNCFSTLVATGFMSATKAVYGSIGVTVSPNDEVKPGANTAVKFIIPKLPVKQGCGAVYKIYITDAGGNVVFESEDSFNEFTFTFPDCTKLYEVRLTATAKSGSGNDGNCTRRLNFKVKPVCNTAVCNCDPVSSKPTASSINLNIEGKLVCMPATSSQRRYNLQYKFVNKTNCNLSIESVEVLGEAVVNTPVTLPARGRSSAYSVIFTTPLSKTAPAGNSLNILVRYKLNDKSCSAYIKIPYTACSQ